MRLFKALLAALLPLTCSAQVQLGNVTSTSSVATNDTAIVIKNPSSGKLVRQVPFYLLLDSFHLPTVITNDTTGYPLMYRGNYWWTFPSLVAGSNVTLSTNGATITITSVGGGGAGGTNWLYGGFGDLDVTNSLHVQNLSPSLVVTSDSGSNLSTSSGVTETEVSYLSGATGVTGSGKLMFNTLPDVVGGFTVSTNSTAKLRIETLVGGNDGVTFSNLVNGGSLNLNDAINLWAPAGFNVHNETVIFGPLHATNSFSVYTNGAAFGIDFITDAAGQVTVYDSSGPNAIMRFSDSRVDMLQELHVLPDKMTMEADSGDAGRLYFEEDTDNGTDLLTLVGPSALSGDITVRLPSVAGTLLTGNANGASLTNLLDLEVLGSATFDTITVTNMTVGTLTLSSATITNLAVGTFGVDTLNVNDLVVTNSITVNTFNALTNNVSLMNVTNSITAGTTITAGTGGFIGPQLQLNGSSSGNIKLLPPATMATNATFYLPGTNGVSGQFLAADSAGHWFFSQVPVATGVSGLGTGIATALAVNTGSAGAPVLFNGALGTPTSGVINSTNVTMYVNTATLAGSATLSTAGCYGSVYYVTSAGTISLPAIAAGMNVTIIADVAGVVVVDPNSSEVIRLSGTDLTGGFAIKSAGATGEIVVLTYYGSGKWYAATATFVTNGS